MSSTIRWAIVSLFVLAGAAAALWLLRPDTGRPTEIMLFGNVDVRQVDLGFRVAGRLEKVLVDEGNSVAAGDTVAALEMGDFKDAVAMAEARLDAQQAELDALAAGSRPAEVAQAEAQVEQLTAALNLARSTLVRRQTLAEDNFASHQMHEEAKAQADIAAARLRIAEQNLTLLREGPRKEKIRAARAQRNALAVSLEIARRRLADAILAAPAEGHILTRIREPGAIIAAGEPIFTLSMISPIWVRTYVDEPDLGRISPDLPVSVTTDSGGRYAGRVGFISPVAEFTPRTVQTRELRTSLVYRVRIIVDNPDAGLRQGMPVTVHVSVDGDAG